jgi:NAD(P)-dependent dehydrogenase (short-subunit alcohol dehydrogenase family)
VSALADSLAGAVAIVTGGANGIGAAIVRRLHRTGANVTFLDIDQDAAQGLVAELSVEDNPVLFQRCDVTREDNVASAVAETIARHGTVHVLVNNAGRNAYFDAITLTEPEWDELVAINLKAMWLCAKHVLPSMLEAHRGSIVNIASIHGFATKPGMFPYAALKAGVVGLTRSLAMDYGRDNIRANAVCPGWVRTAPVEAWLAQQPDPPGSEAEVLRQHPLRRIGTPEEIAHLVAFLSSDDATYITGAAYLIDGGLTAQTI